jgi:hypothetical protein
MVRTVAGTRGESKEARREELTTECGTDNKRTSCFWNELWHLSIG